MTSLQVSHATLPTKSSRWRNAHDDSQGNYIIMIENNEVSLARSNPSESPEEFAPKTADSAYKHFKESFSRPKPKTKDVPNLDSTCCTKL